MNIFDNSFRAVSNRSIKLREEREKYYTEKDGARVNSISARKPAYAGTVLEAKHGGRKKEDEQRTPSKPH
jgi:hypothetical protein